MKYLLFFLCMSFSFYGYTEETSQAAPSSQLSSLEELDAKIATLKEQILAHQNRAKIAGREAERVIFQDQLLYRRYIAIQERNEDIAADLIQELKKLERRRKVLGG